MRSITNRPTQPDPMTNRIAWGWLHAATSYRAKYHNTTVPSVETTVSSLMDGSKTYKLLAKFVEVYPNRGSRPSTEQRQQAEETPTCPGGPVIVRIQVSSVALSSNATCWFSKSTTSLIRSKRRPRFFKKIGRVDRPPKKTLSVYLT